MPQAQGAVALAPDNNLVARNADCKLYYPACPRFVVPLPHQLQRRPQARVFLVGHRAADAERLLAQLAIDHGVGEAQPGMLVRVEAGQGLGRE